MTNASITQEINWSRTEKIFFRIVFVYCILQAIPLDWKYYRHIAAIQWTRFSYRDLFYISRYTPQIFSRPHHPLSWGLNGPADWITLAGLAVLAAFVWGYYDARRKSYESLYYLLRVVLRYRLAIGILAYGFIKLLPMQQPYPSLSLLNTSYGGLSDWKIASLSYGVAPSLEAFLGGVEILAALLLLNRKSASLGAAIVIGFTGNVFLSNLGYNGGEAMYCLYLLSFASIILFYDLPRWINLVSLGKPTATHQFRPHFYRGHVKQIRLFLKSSFIVITLTIFTGFSLRLYRKGGYQYPVANGLPDASGFYNVSAFRLNGRPKPYSLTDSLRWQNVVFEKWNTLSIRTLENILPDKSNTEEVFVQDDDRNYESSGSADRKYYSYRVDSVRGVLQLTNKNRAYPKDVFELAYRKSAPDQLTLSGINENGDSVLAVLDRLQKIYLLNESYQIPQKRSVFQ